MIINILLVFCGGGVGASLRYLFTLIPYDSTKFFGFPLLTFLINLIGSFIIGIVSGLIDEKIMNKYLSTFIKVGVLGGFTTFSSFSLDSITLLEENKWATGSLYIVSSLVLCLLGCFLGRLIIQRIYK